MPSRDGICRWQPAFWMSWFVTLFISIATAPGCNFSPGESPAKGPQMSLQLTSPAFQHAEMIPDRYTCRGQDVSPAVQWSGAPAQTMSFALIFDDPDAPMGTWVHWVVYNLPAEQDSLPEGVPVERQLQDGGLQGTNSWGRLGYGGPCPSSGTHRYFFRLYALDSRLDLAPGATKSQVVKAMEGHVLEQSELMGRYRKR